MKEETILAERIYESRKLLGITQEVLADKLGITPQSVSRWENGQSRPDVDMLPKLAAIFDISIDSLFGYHAENLKIAQYENNFEQSNYHFGNEINKMTREVLGFMPPNKPRTLLEIGCGDGQMAVFFAKNGYIVSAFDISNECLQRGRQLANKAGVNVNFFHADILNYKIGANFDVIYSNMTMHYIPITDRRRIFNILQENTAIGGLNVINVFVEKSFVSDSFNLKKKGHFYQAAELFSYYGQNWKFEMMEEIYPTEINSSVPCCMDVMIARRIN